MPDQTSPYDNMDPAFASKLQALVDASNGRLSIESGYRDEATQQQLYDAAVAKYGPDEAANWVAPPGHSNHEKGIAADLSGDLQWAHEHASEFGLYFPLSNEDWHIEPVGSRDPSTNGAYTTGPRGPVSGQTLQTLYHSQSLPLPARAPSANDVLMHMLGLETDSALSGQLDPLFTYQPAGQYLAANSAFNAATPFQVPEVSRYSPTSTTTTSTTLPSRELPNVALGSSALDRFMAAIRAHESGGNYTIVNSIGAAGAYQFMPSTWNYYGGYATASDAPPEVQDEKARQMMLNYYNQYGNWGDVAAAWYAGPGGDWTTNDVQGYVSAIVQGMG